MSTKLSESTVVLTGGRITFNMVTEYSGLDTGGWEVVAPAFPLLETLLVVQDSSKKPCQTLLKPLTNQFTPFQCLGNTEVVFFRATI